MLNQYNPTSANQYKPVDMGAPQHDCKVNNVPVPARPITDIMLETREVLIKTNDDLEVVARLLFGDSRKECGGDIVGEQPNVEQLSRQLLNMAYNLTSLSSSIKERL